jgi:hypothetical protein
MIIKKGNPDELVCWRSIYPVMGMLDSQRASCLCLAEKCVAYCPRQKVERRMVTDAEEVALLAENVGWQRVAVTAYLPEVERRVAMIRHIDTGEGDCSALPSLTEPPTE